MLATEPTDPHTLTLSTARGDVAQFANAAGVSRNARGTPGNTGNTLEFPGLRAFPGANPLGEHREQAPGGCAVTVALAHGAVMAKTWHADGTATPYGNARTVTLHPHPVADLAALADLLRHMVSKPRACILRGATVTGARMERVRRLLHPDHETGDAPTLREVPRRWVAVDLDDLPLPHGTDPRDLAACGAAVRRFLPHAFRDAAAIIGGTASHGIKQDARLRWWAWLSRPATGAELEAWFTGCPVDLATFRPVQPIYTARPLFAAGMVDPLPERLAMLPGAREVVPVPHAALLRPVRVVRAIAPRPYREGEGGAGALEHARRTIAAAHISTRHDTAKRMAAFLAHLARDGELSEAEALRAIADGIETAGKERAEGEAVARWALAHVGGAA